MRPQVRPWAHADNFAGSAARLDGRWLVTGSWVRLARLHRFQHPRATDDAGPRAHSVAAGDVACALLELGQDTVSAASPKQRWFSRPVDADDEAFWREWQACLERFWGGHVFLDTAFLRASVQHFSTRQLWLCQCGEDGAQQVMLLLEQARPGVFRTFSPSQSQIAPLLIAPGEGPSLAGMFAGLPATCARVDIFQADPLVGQVPPGTRDYADVSPYGVTIAVTTGRPFAAYWGERSKNSGTTLDATCGARRNTAAASSFACTRRPRRC